MRSGLIPTLTLAIFGVLLLVMGHVKLTPDFGGYNPRDADTGLFCLVAGILIFACAAAQWLQAAKTASAPEPAHLSQG